MCTLGNIVYSDLISALFAPSLSGAPHIRAFHYFPYESCAFFPAVLCVLSPPSSLRIISFEIADGVHDSFFSCV